MSTAFYFYKLFIIQVKIKGEFLTFTSYFSFVKCFFLNFYGSYQPISSFFTIKNYIRIHTIPLMQIETVEYSPRGFLLVINVLQGPLCLVGVLSIQRKQKTIINMQKAPAICYSSALNIS